MGSGTIDIMDDLNATIEALHGLLRKTRDSERPTMEDVARVIDDALVERTPEGMVRRDMTGPDTWIWIDESQAAYGIPKHFVLSRSPSDGIEGYPLLTIRQAYSLPLDIWVTVCGLIGGNDEDQIGRSVSILFANHLGAASGLRYSAAAIVANGGAPMAGLKAAKAISDAASETMRMGESSGAIPSDEDLSQLTREPDPSEVN